MWRNVLCATVLLALSFGLAFAEEFKGRIYKAEGNKITVKVGDDKDEKTFELDKDAKIFRLKKGEKTEAKSIADATDKLDEKGRNVTSRRTRRPRRSSKSPSAARSEPIEYPACPARQRLPRWRAGMTRSRIPKIRIFACPPRSSLQ